MKATLLDHLNTVPPAVVRRLSKPFLSTNTLAEKVGVSPTYIKTLSRMWDWRGTPVEIVEAFCAACGHDPLRPRRSLAFLRRFRKTGRGFEHLPRRQLAAFDRAVNQ